MSAASAAHNAVAVEQTVEFWPHVGENVRSILPTTQRATASKSSLRHTRLARFAYGLEFGSQLAPQVSGITPD